MSPSSRKTLQNSLDDRFSDAPPVDDAVFGDTLSAMASRGSCRAFKDIPVPEDILKVLCATALAAPTKSDLQQRDIVLLQSPTARADLAALVSGQAWVANAPVIAVFCGNNRRQRLLHDWHDVPFANDHLDAFFNAATDAAVSLGAFVTAAEAIGLGCCPISAVRNTLRAAVQDYDITRAQNQPYASQRYVELFGTSDAYTWSMDKVRQYSQSERAGFGHYVRTRGFRLD